MSTAPQYNPRYSVEDYRQWKGDWELWNGVAVAMTPSPFGRHGHLLSKIATGLNNAIDQNNCDASVLLEIDWIVSDDTVVRPDLSVVCGPPPAGHIENAPALVVEVLSESTRERDLTIKRELFQRQLVGWYLIIDPEVDSLEVLRLNQDNGYDAVQPQAGQLEVSLCETRSLVIRTDRLFA